jgi:3-phenylpropionate/trans-cinnamate dioxygenase ferredoxin reductase component
VCRWPNPSFGGELMRLEHWTNAAEQGVAAGARLLAAEPEPYAPVPFVWSDQYETKIQVVGHVRGDDEIVVVDGSVDDLRFVAAVGRDDRLVGAIGFSRPRVVMQYRRMIADGTSWSDALAPAQRT